MANREYAQQFMEKAIQAANDRSNPVNIQTAYSLFASACYADPTFDQTFYQVGNANSDMNLLPAATACFRRALECEQIPANRARTLTNLGWRLHGMGKTREALEVTLEALGLDDTLAAAWINLSCIHGVLYDQKRAVTAAYKAFALAPEDPVSEMALAFALLFDGQFAEGLKHFERRFEYKLHAFVQYPYPKWDGAPGKIVFLVADQGGGDTLSFARFVEQACKRAKFVHATVQPEMMRLFTWSFRHIKNLNLLPSPCHFPQADAWTTFVSLPHALGLTDQEIRDTPGIEVDTASPPKHWLVEGRKLHIGIAWSGSPLNEINGHRSIPLKHFLELYRVPGVQLYSFQVDSAKDELHKSGCSPVIMDLSGYIRDYSDTIALLQHLDLVITCESAFGHIAGAVGKETILPYSHLGKDYRIGPKGENILWYPNHRVVLQGEDQRWEPVFEQLVDDLKERVS